MSSYCTRANFEAAFGQDETSRLADRDGVGDETATAIDVQLARASADVDLHLRGAGYLVPVATPTDQLRGWVLDIARYYLFDNVELSEESTQVRRFKSTMATLKMIAAKTLSLDLPLAATPLPSEAGLASFQAAPRLFTRGRRSC